jgi:hypothetical protein
MISVAALGAAPSAWAWGCEGHQVIALVAETHLNPRARAMVFQLLAASPVKPSLPRFCRQSGLDSFADSSTWADDERSVLPDTAAWHFIDIPRGVRQGNIARYCPPVTGCITTALARELQILRNRSATAQARADALRFVIHFVGDLHQPLHATTNNDRGGNCLPVAFFGRAPQETNPRREDYSPNLHEVWDIDIVENSSRGQASQQIADELDRKFRARIPAWQSEPPDFAAWAWETHQVAEVTAYGRLPVKIAIEPPRPVATCADAGHISARMLSLGENLGDEYQNAAAPVAQEQLAKAGIRLAALLNSLWP